jgi:class 3 adenylate cyclase
MFCDLVGSTRLAHRLDPEELHDIISRYQSHCVDAILRHQGHVAQFLGDGVLVYFGYPVAHEDAALRAARASVDIIEGLPKLNRLILRHYDLRVSMRIGIHRGLVVIGELGAGSKREVLAVGETTNIAAKLQASAEPNTIVVSSEVQRLIKKEIATVEHGERSIAGTAEPILAYRVVGRSSNVDDPARLAQPLVARDEERRELERSLERSLGGFTSACSSPTGFGCNAAATRTRVILRSRRWSYCSASASSSFGPTPRKTG